MQSIQIKLSMKLSTPNRQNYSRYAKLCDQTFYHDSEPSQRTPPNYQLPQQRPPPLSVSTTAFSSIPREKRGNFRFPIRLPKGQFTHHPNHLYGRDRSPSWSFSKRERYGKEQFVEYEVCRKSPLLLDNEEAQMRASASSMKELLKDKVRTMRSTSYMSTPKEHKEPEQIHHHNHTHTSLKENASMRETKASGGKNYSIISPRDTSPVGFFNSTKIHEPKYLSKEDLTKLQIKLDQTCYQRRFEPCPKGYIEFHKRRSRKPNSNHKNFDKILYPYNDERQFSNYEQTKYPLIPEGHNEMQKHLDRPDYTPNKLGPNTTPFGIDFTRPAENKINLLLSTFRDRITTRFDRVGAEPNTRLDYDSKEPELGGMVEMDRMIGRNEELFPIVDPIIKKSGDKEMKQELKKYRPIIEINQALRPKNVQNFTQMVSSGN